MMAEQDVKITIRIIGPDAITFRMAIGAVLCWMFDKSALLPYWGWPYKVEEEKATA